MNEILQDFWKAAMKTQALNPDTFILSEFIEEYSGTPIFKLRVQKQIIESN